jgi:thioredoxin 1
MAGKAGTLGVQAGGGKAETGDMALKHLNSVDFDKSVKGPVPVLVDFYTTWCGPCRVLAPVLEQFAEEFKGRLEIVKVNLEEEASLGARFQVTAVPTMMLFQGGIVVDTIVGMPQPEALRGRLETQLTRTAHAA